MNTPMLAAGILLLFATLCSAQALRFDFRGDQSGDRFGHAIASAGDINRDGFDDILVGAPVVNGCVPGGYIRVLSGKDGSILFTVDGPCPYDSSLLGWSVASAGDVNDDGWPDVVAGAPHDFEVGMWSGSARVFLGSYGSWRYTLAGTPGDIAEFGFSVAGGADLNGDAVPDAIIGAPMDNSAPGDSPGAVFLFSGKDGSSIDVLRGDPGLMLGYCLALVGDWNHDGVTDFAAGTANFSADTPGVLRLYSGKDRSLLTTLTAGSPGDAFGASVASAGDVNADGREDIIVGAYGFFGIGPGKAYVFSGSDGSLLHAFSGDQAGDYFGWSVAGAARGHSALGAGDINGDGHADLLVGNLAYHGPPGYVHLYSGKTGALLYRFDEADPGGVFWGSVSGLGDLDHDGLQDFAIGNALEDQDRGHVMVYLGNDLFLCARPRAVATGQTVTLTVRERPAGDSVLLAVTGLDGSPVFLPVATGTFDGTETWQATAVVPPGFSGLTVLLRAWAMDAAGKLHDSLDEAVRIQ